MLTRKIANEDENPFILDIVNQWSQLFDKCNWYEFTLLHLEFENDKMMGGYDLTFILLGLGFRFRWNHTETEKLKECKEWIKEIREKNESNH